MISLFFQEQEEGGEKKGPSGRRWEVSRQSHHQAAGNDHEKSWKAV